VVFCLTLVYTAQGDKINLNGIKRKQLTKISLEKKYLVLSTYILLCMNIRKKSSARLNEMSFRNSGSGST